MQTYNRIGTVQSVQPSIMHPLNVLRIPYGFMSPIKMSYEMNVVNASHPKGGNLYY
jgi:hypothetical protein